MYEMFGFLRINRQIETRPDFRGGETGFGLKGGASNARGRLSTAAE